MRAMIFAAGLGTRLRPLTDSIPKALVQVDGKSLLERCINKLKQHGFDEIIINTHHFSEQIKAFLQRNDNFDVDIIISDESEKLLNTGGGVKNIRKLIDRDEPILIHNVDIISNINLSKLYQEHISDVDRLGSLVVSERDTFRYLLFDENNELKGWVNEQTKETKPFEKMDVDRYRKLAFSGIQVVSPQVFELMEGYEDVFSIIDFYLQSSINHRIVAYEPESLKMMDIGKIETISEAESFLKSL